MLAVCGETERDEVVKLMKIMEEDNLTLAEAEVTVRAMHNMLFSSDFGSKEIHEGISFTFPLEKKDIKVI